MFVLPFVELAVAGGRGSEGGGGGRGARVRGMWVDAWCWDWIFRVVLSEIFNS